MLDASYKINTEKCVLAAFFMALGVILPFVTMQIPAVGNMLLPMHIPVLLCGFICGAPYGAVIGFVLPLLRSVLFGVPVMMPNACGMAIELLCYGFFSGILYNGLHKLKKRIFISLICSMLIGRVAWGLASCLFFYLQDSRFTWIIFVTQAFIKAIPGIVIQLITIPLIVGSIEKISIRSKLKGYPSRII